MCLSCPAGQYSPANATACEPCALGRYAQTASSASCAPCGAVSLYCSAGQGPRSVQAGWFSGPLTALEDERWREEVCPAGSACMVSAWISDGSEMPARMEQSNNMQ